jgi:hypothetical protein
MAIYRTALPGDHYTPIPNAWLRTPTLTAKEKVVMAIVASHREGYRLTIQQLIGEMHEGRDAVYGAIKGLVDKGWMLSIQNRAEDGTLGEVDYMLTGGPEEAVPEVEEAPAVAARRRRQLGRVQPVPENPEPVRPERLPRSEPVPGFPEPAEPEPGEPEPANPTHRRPLRKKTNVTLRNVAGAVDNSGESEPATASKDGALHDDDHSVLQFPVSHQRLASSQEAGTADGIARVQVDHDDVDRVMAQLPDRLQPSRAEARRLRDLVIQRMERGWTREEILAAVERNLRDGGKLKNPCGLFATTLVPLQPPTRGARQETPHHAPKAPWCGHCDEKTRFLLDECGFPDNAGPKCPECEHLAFAEHMQRGAS